MPDSTTTEVVGPIDTIDAVLREYLGSMVATEAAINVWRALRRGGI